MTVSIPRRALLRLAAALPVAALPALAQARSATSRYGAGYFPNFELEAHTGQRLRLYDDMLKGKLVLLNFTYATCDGICPTVTENLKQVHGLLGDRIGRDIFMYSITLRPELDTAAVLREHVDMHGIGHGWLYLRTEPAQLYTLRKRLGAVDPDPVIDADYTQHSGMVHIGNEPLERWMGCPGEARAEWIAKAVLRMDGPRPVRRTTL